MTREQAFLWLAEAVMVAALCVFVQGFRVRRSDRALHMKLGKIGALIVFAGLLAVEFMLRVVGWKFPIRDFPILGWQALHVHITVACVATLVLIALAVTGMRGPRSVHVKLYVLFFPSYVATIVLSWFAFELW